MGIYFYHKDGQETFINLLLISMIETTITKTLINTPLKEKV